MSGLTESNLSSAKVTLEEVQKALLSLFNSRTILIGHSLENDLRVLKIIHKTVVDTAIVYQQGKKVKLKVLANDLLNEVIQNEEEGHNSAEDAVTCIKLMRLKVEKDAKLNNKPKAPVMKSRYSHRDLGI